MTHAGFNNFWPGMLWAPYVMCFPVTLSEASPAQWAALVPFSTEGHDKSKLGSRVEATETAGEGRGCSCLHCGVTSGEDAMLSRLSTGLHVLRLVSSRGAAIFTGNRGGSPYVVVTVVRVTVCPVNPQTTFSTLRETVDGLGDNGSAAKEIEPPSTVVLKLLEVTLVCAGCSRPPGANVMDPQ